VHPGGYDEGVSGGWRTATPPPPVGGPPTRAFTAAAAAAAAADGGDASTTIATETVAIASPPAPATHYGPYLDRAAAALARGCVSDAVTAAADVEVAAAARPPVDDGDGGRESDSQPDALAARFRLEALAALAQRSPEVPVWAFIGGSAAVAAARRSLWRQWAAGGVLYEASAPRMAASAMWRRLRRRRKPPACERCGRPRRPAALRCEWGREGTAAPGARGGGALRLRVVGDCRGVVAAAAAG